MRPLLLFVSLFVFSTPMLAQQPITSKVSGVVLDENTKAPIASAKVFIKANGTNMTMLTNEKGEFAFPNVPIGYVQVDCEADGYVYESYNVVLTKAKDFYLMIELVEFRLGIIPTVTIHPKTHFQPVNPLSVVSSRSFTAEETDRIAAGINDPGRVALSFPGVKQGPDENENAIIVRGNSPVGILWRVEGIDIPNPNHFALIGSSVGGVNVFSAQLLSRSDFSSGGMAAEYGNALSGAFDMHFRKGNFEKREHRVKIGVIGLDFATEGPIKKEKSSYLVNYRYSTLGLLNRVGFHPVGERVSNDFQDLSFNVAFNRSPRLKTTLFGLGGSSLEQYDPVAVPAERDTTQFDQRNLQYKPAKMGAVGSTLTYLANDHAYLRAVVALVGSDIRRENDTLNELNTHYRYNTERYVDRRLSASVVYNNRISQRATIRTGAIFHQIFFDFFKNNAPVASQIDINNIERAGISVQGKGHTQSVQQYAMALLQVRALKANLGYHFTYLAANGTYSMEPRVSLKYEIHHNHHLSAVYGLQGQMLPLMAYYFKDDQGQFINKQLPMMRAHHTVLAYHFYTKNRMKISAEAYLQLLDRIPVAPDATRNYWLLNNTNGYPLFKVVSEGKGTNKGIDLAVEKQFTKSYFVLANFSVFDSKLRDYTGTVYNTNWAARFSSSLTFGKEFSLNQNRVLQIGGRFLYSGGNRYTPHDPVESALQGTYVALPGALNTAQVPNFYRLDTRIQYRYNTRKMAGSISLDIQNALNHLNATGVTYDAASNTTVVQYRGGGLIPVVAFQFDF